MAAAAFQTGAEVRIHGKHHILLRMVGDDLWQLEETKTKRIHEMQDMDLRRSYASGALVFHMNGSRSTDDEALRDGRSHTEVPENLMEAAKVRRLYALASLEGPATQRALEVSAKKTWEQLKKPEKIPHWTSVYRWRRKLIAANRDIHAVVAQTTKQGNRKPRFPDAVVQIVEKAIDTVYLTLEKRSQQDVLDKAVLDVRRENALRPIGTHLPEPSYRMVRSMINDIPAFDRCLAREGRTVAMRRFRSVLRHRTTEAPLQRAEIDHTLLDLMVIDDTTGLPLGRPLLTACIDDYTRCVLGIHIAFEPPSFLTVARCLKHVFLPKTDLNEVYPEIVNEWAAHGVMRELSMDNGSEFHSNSLEQACYSLGIEIHYSPRKTPWFKGKIERWQGTANSQVAQAAPGTTFSNIFEKDEYDPVKHAVVRLSTLQRLVRIWIVDVYHQRPHRTLKVPPAAMWNSSIAPEDILLPEDPAQLDAILGRRERRILSHKGIELEGLFYNSPEMTRLRMNLGEKLPVEICIDDGDIGKIVVLSPDKERMFVVPALAQTYAAGMTTWQHRVCKRYASREMNKHDSTGWLEAKERIAQMIADEFTLKKAKGKTRTRAARYLNGGEAVRPEIRSDSAAPVVLPPTAIAPPPGGAARSVDQASSRPAPSTTVPTPRFAPVVRQRGNATNNQSAK